MLEMLTGYLWLGGRNWKKNKDSSLVRSNIQIYEGIKSVS
jgi:hypothetical protein